MAAPTPILDHIFDDLKSALASISAGDTYHYTYTVREPTSKPESVRDLVMEIYPGNLTTNSETVEQATTWTQNFLLVVYVQQPNSTVIAVRKKMNRILSDVIVALCGTDATGQRNGLANQTNIISAEFYDDGPEQGIAITVEVQFSHQFGEPGTLR